MRKKKTRHHKTTLGGVEASRLNTILIAQKPFVGLGSFVVYCFFLPVVYRKQKLSMYLYYK